jgi:hypothetical protein
MKDGWTWLAAIEKNSGIEKQREYYSSCSIEAVLSSHTQQKF